VEENCFRISVLALSHLRRCTTVQALPLRPGGSDNFHDPLTMILFGSVLLLLAFFNGKFFKK